MALFLAGATLHLFATTSMGIFMATLARSMPQFGLLWLLGIGAVLFAWRWRGFERLRAWPECRDGRHQRLKPPASSQSASTVRMRKLEVRWTTDTAVTRYFRSSITLCG